MTHKDIYTKFMIEYDKANVTSSYPSLTEYEVATVLDKAYNALIAQKVTGNNFRRAPFEVDLKAITDIQPLIVRNGITFTEQDNINIAKADLPADLLYYVQLMMNQDCTTPIETEKEDTDQPGNDNPSSGGGTSIDPGSQQQIGGDTPEVQEPVDEPITNPALHAPIVPSTQETTDDTTEETTHPYDGYDVRQLPVKLTSHDVAEKFIVTPYNMPWVKNPVAFMEYDDIYVVFDPVKKPAIKPASITYIKVPNKFTKDINHLGDFLDSDEEATQVKTISNFDWSLLASSDDMYVANDNLEAYKHLTQLYTFECNDTVAEELISLAVAFALENVESQRLNSKLNMRGLEA